MDEVRRLLDDVADTDVAVFLYGESGTGKEVAARYLHARSRRADRPFVALNCAAIPAELMESEIFGHEKGAFTGATDTRPGLLRARRRRHALPRRDRRDARGAAAQAAPRARGRSRASARRNDERVFDVRHLAATNREPREAIAAGRLREDLYYRLNVFQVDLPPLRDRPADVAEFVSHFVEVCNARHGLDVADLDEEAAEAVAGYRWPGNVRELRNVVERGVVLTKAGSIGIDQLPLFLREGEGARSIEIPVGISVAEAEKILILKTLELTGQNKAEAARRLGVDVKTIRQQAEELRNLRLSLAARIAAAFLALIVLLAVSSWWQLRVLDELVENNRRLAEVDAEVLALTLRASGRLGELAELGEKFEVLRDFPVSRRGAAPGRRGGDGTAGSAGAR